MRRAERVKMAMVAIVARGDQPSPGKIQRELGDRVTHDLNGRDSKVYAEQMRAMGFVRARNRNHVNRWFRVAPPNGEWVVTE